MCTYLYVSTKKFFNILETQFFQETWFLFCETSKPVRFNYLSEKLYIPLFSYETKKLEHQV